MEGPTFLLSTHGRSMFSRRKLRRAFQITQ